MDDSNDNKTWNSTIWNLTIEGEEMEAPLLKKVHDVVVLVLLIVIMFSMGCIISPMQIWEYLKMPVGIGIGLLSQFLALPLCAFCLVKALQIQPIQATGVLVLATCPGGVTSNVLTYMVEGSVALSVAMTIMSTLLALGMMPLNLWIYAGHLANAEGGLVIPYGNIGLSLVFVTVPVLFGMICKWKFPKASLIISKSGTYVGLFLIVLMLVFEIILYPDIFSIIVWQLYVTLALLPILSLMLGYGLAWIFRQPMDVRKTVAIECSIQNVGLSITIITLSFPFKLQKQVIAFSYIYPVSMFSSIALTVVIYKLWKRYSSSANKEISDREMTKEATEFLSASKSEVCLPRTNGENRSNNEAV